MSKIKKILKWFANKPIIIFACAGNNNVQKDIDDIIKNNFNEAQMKMHKFFYLPGGVDFSKVKGILKPMLNFFKKSLEKKSELTPDEQAMLDGFTNPTNLVDKKHIQALIDYAKML